MFHYEKMFEPFTKDGSTLELSISWLKKTTGADDRIIDQVVNDTMQALSQNKKFTLPCPCGCGMTNVHTPINHYMLSRAYDLKDRAETAFIRVIKENEKQRLQARQKQLSNFNKEYDKMINGTWFDKNTPTFKRWMGFK